MRIGIDLMGGDNPPEHFFPAILQAAKQLPSGHSLIILAVKAVTDRLSSLISSSLSPKISARIAFQECEDVIAMTDDPLSAVRRKKKSSLVKGMDLLKNRNIDAFVSCGNTGALIASAAIALPLLPGISHPALLALLPSERGQMAVLDVGGSVSRKYHELVRLAFLGAAFQKAVHGIKKPTVGLLNVGVESRKGTVEVRQAYEDLDAYCRSAAEDGSDPEFHFSGNIEARDLFKGTVDVLVTDGFTGNVLLKTAEGVAAFIFEALQEKKIKDAAFNDLKKRFNYLEYPGAIVCGVEGVVVKVHGNASSESVLASIFSSADYAAKI